MRLRADGRVLRDEHGRQRVLHGINLVAKGSTGSSDAASFRGAWTADDIADLAARGLTVVRLGVIWDAVEPEPGRYDDSYLDWIGEQLDLLGDAGIGVVLDAHQDLYSQSFGDGAPDWATLTKTPFVRTDLWSDAYLSSAAVHEALDAFWANAPGPTGIGLQDSFASMWRHVATRFGGHRALIGYDLLNEPAPGSPSQDIFAALIGAFAQATGQTPEQVAADFSDPVAKLAQLDRLDDVRVHRAVGDAVGPLVAAFEAGAVAPLMERVRQAIRTVDADALILREHSYFANLGVPSGQPPLPDDAWVYSPHGYDLTVDTPAIVLSSDTRVETIFARHRETQERLGVPVLVGEWGAFDDAVGIGRHARSLLDLFDAYQWSWTYWCWTPGFAQTEAAEAMTRPRPLAIAGDAVGWRVEERSVEVEWEGRHSPAPTEIWLPDRLGASVVLERDGATGSTTRSGDRVLVEPRPGRHRLVATW